MTYTTVRGKGSGGFARVLVVQNEEGEEFAKKVYAPREDIVEAVGDATLKKRFRREVKYQQKIMHPNVVPILDTALNEDPPFFIMPLAEITLEQELKDDPRLGGRFRDALFDILAGLERVHELGFAHRDLKPGNVLKFKGEERDYYAISDFGLLSVNDTNTSNLTGENAKGGTQNYSAPELIRDLKTATATADIYSFGAILHDIFGKGAHRTPYSELSLPGEIGEVIQKCTKRVPVRRYNNIAELRDDLYRVLNDSTIEFSSSDEQVLSQLLAENVELTDEQWDEVFLYLLDHSDTLKDCRNIFASLSIEHIHSIYNNIPELFPALGRYFSDFISNLNFDFDYCDVLASKAEIFYDYGDLSLKAKIVLAILQLGIRHNRFYVERKFLNMVKPNISDNLADRIVTEVEVEEIDFAALIDRLELSIGCDREDMHPIIVQFLAEINESNL